MRLPCLISRANAEARAAYRKMVLQDAFDKPLAYASLDLRHYDALLLPGGHWARGMVSYLESEVLQRFVAAFFDSGKPVAAICHGVVLAARSRSAATGKSVLCGRKTTALTWRLENSAWKTMKFAGRFWDPDYFRTYVEKPGSPWALPAFRRKSRGPWRHPAILRTPILPRRIISAKPVASFAIARAIIVRRSSCKMAIISPRDGPVTSISLPEHLPR
jgi:hypothetical protein